MLLEDISYSISCWSTFGLGMECTFELYSDVCLFYILSYACLFVSCTVGQISQYNLQVRVVRRDNGAKTDIPTANLVNEVKQILFSSQECLFNAAKEKRDACIKVVTTWDEFIAALNDKKMILAPWCDEEVRSQLVRWCMSC